MTGRPAGSVDDDRSRTPWLIGAGIVAVALAAATGGALWLPDEGTVDRGSAAARGVVGAGIALAVCVTALAVLHLTGVLRWRRSNLGALAAATIVGIALGLLIGAANAGPETEAGDRPSDDTVDPRGDGRDGREGRDGGDGGEFGGVARFTEDASVGLVDADGDGVPDRGPDGALLIALDGDGDGVIDGRLVPCDGSDEVTRDQGTVALDLGCDGTIDRRLRLSPALISELPAAWPDVGELDPREIDPDLLDELDENQADEHADDDEGDDGTDDQRGDEGGAGAVVKTLLIIAAAVAVAVLVARLWVAWRGRPARPDAGLLDDEEEPEPDAGAVDAALETSIETLLGHPDPRTAIRAAYAVLLDALADSGFPRQRFEGPEEHLGRCLQELSVEPAPMRELLRLFAVARFSNHTVTEHERAEALAALRASQAELRRQMLQPAAAAEGPGSWPSPEAP